ncbi:MAG: sensor histidine kinase [Treponema sp.]|jgi:two-component system sensor histidine kinase YesM|nr:sensor histidine kinase [Treponema sp.]
MRKHLLRSFKQLFISSSIRKTIQTSHVVIVVLMLIPLVLGAGITLFNTLSYDRLISNVHNTNRLNQIVKSDITNELWDIVAGNKQFSAGSQYAIIADINAQIEGIKSTAAEEESRQHMEVAGRAMNTLISYVNRLGMQIRESYPVIENERTLDEIRSVISLVSDILQDFTALEIESAARASEDLKQLVFIILVLEMLTIFGAALFSVFVQMSVTGNIGASIGALVSLSGRIAEGDLSAQAENPPVTELRPLTEDLNTLAGKIKALIEDNVREQKNLQKSEMKALQAQITPHFLYNTLDSIIWLAEGSQYEEVISITRAFSNFFRISLNRGNEWVSVKDEFNHVENYLTVQKIRYRDLFDYIIEYDETLSGVTILKLLLQPLVENALYHGIKNRRGKGNIGVCGRRQGAHIVFTVKDNGIGMSEETIASIRRQMNDPEASNAIYGLYNVSKRLELYYNKEARIELESVYGQGTTVILSIPLEHSNV